MSDAEIGRRLGVHRSTVRGWRNGRCRSGPKSRGRDPDCICRGEIADAGAYAYLLGLYLGDGYIIHQHRGVYKFTVTMDARYTMIMDECAEAMLALRPHSDMKIGRVPQTGCVNIIGHWKHWACMFPQHGPGRKHERPIKLRNWQQDIVDTNPDLLLRGLIHSDGWRGMNRVRSPKGKLYAYPRYQFCNHSDDIQEIFCKACDAFGVEWRQMNRWNISVARRASVAKLDEVIGPKG